MSSKVRKEGQTVVVELEGKFSLGPAVDDFRSRWTEALAGGAQNIVVNLAGVPMVDSSGIGSLIRCHSAVNAAGGKLMIVGATNTVMQAFKVTRLDRVLALHPDEKSALAVL
jgi:anti-sigma B factor antagonist